MTRRTERQTRTCPAGGSVLILSLWILFLLCALAMAVGSRVSSALDASRRLMRRTEAYYLARAGVENALMWMATCSNGWDGLTDEETLFQDVRLGGGTYSVFYRTVLRSGDEVNRYGVLGEESRVSINRSEPELIAALARVAGGADAATAAEIAASICDWRDTDDEVLTGGAEESYYRGLEPGYSCRNGEFESLYELPLVKGVTAEIFARMKPFLTLYGTGKINLNSADYEVLTAVAVATGEGDAASRESSVERILQYRASGLTFDEEDPAMIMQKLGGVSAMEPAERSVLSGMMRFLTIRSSCFGGTARGVSGAVNGAGGVAREIEFVGDVAALRLVYWREK